MMLDLVSVWDLRSIFIRTNQIKHKTSPTAGSHARNMTIIIILVFECNYANASEFFCRWYHEDSSSLHEAICNTSISFSKEKYTSGVTGDTDALRKCRDLDTEEEAIACNLAEHPHCKLGSQISRSEHYLFDYWVGMNALYEMLRVDPLTPCNAETMVVTTDDNGRAGICPPRYSQGTVLNGGTSPLPQSYENGFACYRPIVDADADSCFGNPIIPSSRTKIQYETDYVGTKNLTYTRKYDATANGSSSSDFMGANWQHLWFSNIIGPLYGQTHVTLEAPPNLKSMNFFPLGDGTWGSEIFLKGRLSDLRNASGAKVGWIYESFDAQLILQFGLNGLLEKIVKPSGETLTLNYNNGALQGVKEFEREVKFLYDENNMIASVIDPAGIAIKYSYSLPTINSYSGSRNLDKVEYQDLSDRKYIYSEASHVNNLASWQVVPFNILTGIEDENHIRYADYVYEINPDNPYFPPDILSSEHAGGVEKYIIEDYRTITDPLGNDIKMTYSLVPKTFVQGKKVESRRDRPAGSGCPASWTMRNVDEFGDIVAEDNYNNRRTCYVHNSQHLETLRVEGLLGGNGTGFVQGDSCDLALPPVSIVPAGARHVNTVWHPYWATPITISEPERITTFVYNGQPDPFNGNTVSWCAPTSATLPGGKPIVVLCKKVQQSTSDSTGALGFSAVAQPNVPVRQWTYTYNDLGQVLTENGPRPDADVVDKTTYVYYATSTADYTKGDLKQVTNAVGKVTAYPKYNKHGQVLRMVDANSVATNYTYDLRQRLTSVSVGGQLTRYDYWPTGLLKKVTQPDQISFAAYDYDDAHRLVKVSDNLGNSITYTLDNSGNRTGETVKDPNSNLRRQLIRQMDALGRVQRVTGRE